MADHSKDGRPGGSLGPGSGRGGLRIPIVTRLTLSFLLVIGVISVAFAIVGALLIRNWVVAEAQEMVRRDLNAAREIYLDNLRGINDIVRLTADRFFLRDALRSGDLRGAAAELVQVRLNEGLDVLTVTDPTGRVILRTTNPDQIGDDQLHNALVSAALTTMEPVASTVAVAGPDLQRESPWLAEQAQIRFIDTPLARQRPESELTSGLMLEAAAPVTDEDGVLLGAVYGGVLLNRNFTIVDEIKRTVFESLTYNGQDMGTATIFQDDVRISTNVLDADGSRAVGTRLSEEVYDQVVLGGKPWVGRAFVVNNWYITAYEPIRDYGGNIVGVLYVGLLEQKYVDIGRETLLIFLGITLLGALACTALSIIIARRMSVPIHTLASASRELAAGNLDAKVEIGSKDELGELADAFNVMSAALKERDAQLKDFATRKIMESERLALIGQLSANVAHELNNPLQGIVTYSHLLLERHSPEDSSTEFLQKIVTQANRCRDIIRGLLDFSRQRKPDKTFCNVNTVLQDCLSLVRDQALFQNIHLELSLQEDLPMAVIDPSQIERVFMNMIINAAEAMEGGGRLSMATHYDAQHRVIEVEFQDTGHGIPEENLERIFDPFFTTKDAGHGTGLGLAISYGIVKEHRGSISVKSVVDQGTTFTIRLPVTAEEEGQGNGRPG